MITWLKRNTLIVLVCALGLFLLSAGMLAGVAAMVALQQPAAPMAELPLFASATDTGETMSIATGPIEEEMEGLFILDFVTGDLACAVLNPRTYTVGGVFRTNIVAHLDIDKAKKPAYLMTTGNATFVGKGVSSQPGRCVVYVCDQNTGNFGAFSLSWNRTAAQKGVVQGGELIALYKGNARAVKAE